MAIDWRTALKTGVAKHAPRFDPKIEPVVSKTVRYTSFPAKRANGSDTFRLRGNAYCAGNAPGPIQGITGGKGWTVPAAFKK